MKKKLIIAAFVLVAFTALFVGIGGVYFKPFIKNTIKEQLAVHGYENAEIGDISFGLYESTISEINLNNPQKTRIGSIAISYWPQQLLSKKVNSITIKDAKIDAQLRLNGDVIVAGYKLEGILKQDTQKETYLNQVNMLPQTRKAGLSLISQAHAADNTSNDKAAMPFNNIIVKGLDFDVTVPSGEQIKGLLDAEYNMSSASTSGKIKLNQTKASALFEAANIAKPDLSQMVKNVQGTISTNMSFDINDIKNMNKIGGNGTITLNNVGADKDDIKIRGVNGTIDVDNILPFNTDGKQEINIQKVIKSVVEITDINTVAAISDTTKIDLEKAVLNVAGGQIISNPFKADLTNINTDVLLLIKSVQFQELAKLLELSGVLNLRGTVSAELPLTIKNNQLVLDKAAVNSIIQSVAGSELRKQADKLIQRKLGDKLDRFIGTPANNNTDTQQKKPDVKDVINGIMGGF